TGGIGHLTLHRRAVRRRAPAARIGDIERHENRNVPAGQLRGKLPGLLPTYYHGSEAELFAQLERTPDVCSGIGGEVDATVSGYNVLQRSIVRIAGSDASAVTRVGGMYCRCMPGVLKRLTLERH